MMWYLNSFSASGGGNLNKKFPKIQMPGGGEGCLSFNLTVTLLTVNCYSISVTGNNTVNIQSRAKRDHRYMAILRNIHINYK